MNRGRYGRRLSMPNVRSSITSLRSTRWELFNVLFRSVNTYMKYIISNTTIQHLPWRFHFCYRLSLEEGCLVLLQVLATVVMRRGKRSVVCVDQCVRGLASRLLPDVTKHTKCLIYAGVFIDWQILLVHQQWLRDDVDLMHCECDRCTTYVRRH